MGPFFLEADPIIVMEFNSVCCEKGFCLFAGGNLWEFVYFLPLSCSRKSTFLFPIPYLNTFRFDWAHKR